jgi:hypothetical protein
MMKRYIILIVTVFFALNTFAQKGRGQVNLTNGSKVKGLIMSWKDNGDVIIKSHGNIWNFESSMVDTVFYFNGITANPVPDEKIKTKNFRIFNQAEAGVLIGNPDNERDLPFVFNYSVNYKATEKFNVGLGTGIEFLKETHMPVFANFQYRFRNAHFTPALFLKAGYQIPIEDTRTSYRDLVPDGYITSPNWPDDLYYSVESLSAKGGVLVNPGVGFTSMFSRSFGISCVLGYRYSRLRYEADNSYKIDIDYNRLSVMLGIIFN